MKAKMVWAIRAALAIELVGAGAGLNCACAVAPARDVLAWSTPANRLEHEVGGHPISFWVHQLDDLEPGRRQQAANQLATAATNGADADELRPAIAPLTKMLQDPVGGLRVSGANALICIEPKGQMAAALPVLIKALVDSKEPGFQMGAAKALVPLGKGHPEVVQGLKEAIQNASDDRIRRWVQKVLDVIEGRARALPPNPW